MKTEEQQLLLTDLCARLPYGVKVYGNYSHSDGEKIVDDIQTKVLDIYDIDWVINNIEVKPYLFPLSSLTKNKLNEICKYAGLDNNSLDVYEWNNQPKTIEFFLDEVSAFAVMRVFEWLNKNHIDYNGLISKGLAIDATGLNIY